MAPCTMRFGSPTKVLAKSMLNYYRISECPAIIGAMERPHPSSSTGDPVRDRVHCGCATFSKEAAVNAVTPLWCMIGSHRQYPAAVTTG